MCARWRSRSRRAEREDAHLPVLWARAPPSERFCASCGMPLVHPPDAADAEPGERREHARKIKPQYSEGRLVKVAYAPNPPPAGLIQGGLVGGGISRKTPP